MSYKPQPSKIQVGAESGYLRIGTIQSINQTTFTAQVKFSDIQYGQTDQITAQLPVSYLSSGGGMIGGYVEAGTTVVLGQAESSGIYYIVAFLGKDPAARNTTTISNLGAPTFLPGQLVLQANVNGSILFDDDGIYLGEPQNLLTLDTYRNLFINTFDSAYTITQASREITGVIKRDVRPSINFAQFLRTTDPTYDDTLKIIGMDPIAPARTSNFGDFIRNPARIESREVVYEYEDDAQVQSNDIEISNYTKNSAAPQTDYGFINRREGRADILSLSQISPNYLIETVKGSVVDVFGNMVDINRNIIPIGQGAVSVSKIKTTLTTSDTFQNAYQQIKREERKNIAYHFELNAKKEVAIVTPPDVNSRIDYARARSRFSLDIDKEGQLKLNVPASSEYGNIPLLTRYENYSTVNPNPKTNDPNDLMFNTNGNGTSTDILIESFVNNPVISLIDSLQTNAAPLDRFSPIGQTNYIKHGTAYHDITQTCISMQAGSGLYIPDEYTPFSEIALQEITPLQTVVSTTIQVSGAGANAGGRSASLNFDGMVELNVGASTIDRSSMWIDTEGGIVANIGRDLPNNASVVASTDGGIFLEVGGRETPQDSRFVDPAQTQAIAGVFDIRVSNGAGEWTCVRIDEAGITITTPSRITLVSNGDMSLMSSGTLTINSEVLNIQGRNVLKSRTPI